MEASFKYRNHRGDIEQRTIDVDTVEWLAKPGFDYQPGWFVSGMCHDRKARRSFALSNIVLPYVTQSARLFRVPYAPQEAVALDPEVVTSGTPELPPVPITHYVHFNGYGIFVKEERFFVEQGGLNEDWGKAWKPVCARNEEHARELGMNMEWPPAKPKPQPAPLPWGRKDPAEYVPKDQTPLNADLKHPLLAAFDAGSESRESGQPSPYHGHSVEHMLHSAGWVSRDLRLALDAERAKRDELYKQASRLLLDLAKKHFPSSDILPMQDLVGVLSQIDNLTSAMVHTSKLAAVCNERDEAYKQRREIERTAVEQAQAFDAELTTVRKQRDGYNDQLRLVTHDLESTRAALAEVVTQRDDARKAYDILAQLFKGRWGLGARLTKTKGSSWTGRVVGFYISSLTALGYVIESENEPGSCQLYPESALEKK